MVVLDNFANPCVSDECARQELQGVEFMPLSITKNIRNGANPCVSDECAREELQGVEFMPLFITT